MQEVHEIWITKLFNHYLAGPGNAALALVGRRPEPRPWVNFITMELLVVVLMMLLFALIRARLSTDKPDKLQQSFEVTYEFLRDQAEDYVPHHAGKYLPFFGTIFLFVLFSNLIGVVPGFESPTMYVYVTVGCAVAVFVHYNAMGLSANGLGYLKHFVGPSWGLAILMIPIEIVSNLARPLSLSVRLFANMFAGEQVTTVFLGLTKFVVPVAFMGLHIFVALIQAYIFALLSMIYVGGAVSHEQ
ncbi:MAG: F0F1 ATP synthase subunit A [Bryobacteraceae bacterium]